MMPSDFIPTGSISQDALRLGFQTTCTSGIETLLKVNDVTIEACKDFKERHIMRLNEKLIVFAEEAVLEAEKYFHRNFVRGLDYNKFTHQNKLLFFSWLYYIFYVKPVYNSQSKRKFTVVIDSIDDNHYVDLRTGEWVTNIHYTTTAEAWEGYGEYGYRKFNQQITKSVYHFRTPAKVCTVQYVNYDEYHDQFVPDDAATAAAQAKEIGMTDFKVAIPHIQDSVKRDPIIVAHVKKQMFIIAWFGYDKNNHMSCNI